MSWPLSPLSELRSHERRVLSADETAGDNPLAEGLVYAER